MSINGWIALDKPYGMTSAQAVGLVKKKIFQTTGTKVKVGHTGTLDPFATGVLPLALGEATKLCQLLLSADKAYEFTLQWGTQTDTLDLTGHIVAENDFIPSQDQIIAILNDFIGSIEQVPPRFSALKVNGKRAYDLARQQQDFELASRQITIYQLDLISHDLVQRKTKFFVKCSKGTYVRVLGQDIAHKLGGVGHLSALKRTKVGFFSLESTILPDIDHEMVYKAIVEVYSPLDDIPAIILNKDQSHALRCGQNVMWNTQDAPKADIFLALDADQKIIALVSHDQKGFLLSRRGFNY